jgi:hypothetical protein
MAESGGVLMPDGRVTADASAGLVLERVHEPDEALEHALDRSPGTTLLDHLAVSSGDEAGTVHITVRSTAERFVAVLAWSDSGVRGRAAPFLDFRDAHIDSRWTWMPTKESAWRCWSPGTTWDLY